METLKKFWKYFLIFIALFLFISFFTNYEMKESYKDIKEYEIKTLSPEIKVDEFRASRTNGYIKGNVTNNSGDFFENKYLKINLFDKNSIYLGSEYKEFKHFHNNETIKFDIGFKYENVESATLEITDYKQEKEKLSFFKNINWEDNAIKNALVIGIFLGIYPFIP